jgi:hypothetical protein
MGRREWTQRAPATVGGTCSVPARRDPERRRPNDVTTMQSMLPLLTADQRLNSAPTPAPHLTSGVYVRRLYRRLSLLTNKTCQWLSGRHCTAMRRSIYNRISAVRLLFAVETSGGRGSTCATRNGRFDRSTKRLPKLSVRNTASSTAASEH